MALMGYVPYDHSMRAVVDRAIDEILHHHHFRHYANIKHLRSLKYGSPIGEVMNTSEKFSFTVDVSHFQPNEVKVNATGNLLTIEGNQDEKTDEHGSIKRSFLRKYTLPDDPNLESIRSTLTQDGHLTIEAPKKTKDLAQSRAISITMTTA